MSPWKPSVPAPDVLTECWEFNASLAAVGLPCSVTQGCRQSSQGGGWAGLVSLSGC